MKKNSRQKTFSLLNSPVIVTFKKIKRAKHIRIHVSSPEHAVVTGPFFTPYSSLESFFRENQKWLEEKIRYFHEYPNKTIKLSEEEYRQKKEAARTLVFQKIEYWNQAYGFAWSRVSIRNQSTRWGSCSSQKGLSFHAGIVDLPIVLQDYLIVHELCHLKEMNHGSAFWQLVQTTIPNAKSIDKRLKKYTNTSIL